MKETIFSPALQDRWRLKRAFPGTAINFLEELFLFSRENGARTVRIDTQPHGFTYSDDGRGVPETQEYWHTLLHVPGPDITFPIPSEQAPPGVVVFQLLASLDISQATFASGRFAATIDPDQWWETPEYFTDCDRLVTQEEESVPGFRVTAFCTADLSAKLEKILKRVPRNPAQGYGQVLEILLNGVPVASEPPLETRFSNILFETSYLGNRLVFMAENGASGYINWFGHTEYTPALGPFSYYLEVRNGAPLTLLRPLNKEFAGDERWEDFVTFIKEQIKHFLFNPVHQGKVKPEWILWLCETNPTAQPECPYVIVAPYLHPTSFKSCQFLKATGPLVLKTHAEMPFLLDPSLRLLMTAVVGNAVTSDHDKANYGIDSFLPLLEDWGIEAFQFVWGDRKNIPLHSLWWKPGDCLHDLKDGTDDSSKFFHEPGVWGIGTANQPPEPTEWKMVGSIPVFAFDWEDCWSITRVAGLMVGTQDPVGFVENFGWVGFDPHHDEYDEEEIAESYDQSLKALIQTLKGEVSAQPASTHSE